MSKMKVGAQLYSVRAFTKTLADVATTLKKIAAIGYSQVQVSGFGDKVDPKEVAPVLADSGLVIAATHVGWDFVRDRTDDAIAQHTLWKCKHIAVGGLPGEYHQAGADGVKRFIDELAVVAPKLAAAGMDFSYHNHNHELAHYAGRPWLGMLYEQAPAALLKAELDVHWLVAGGADPVQWINKCAGRQPLLHLKDFVILPDRTVRFAEIGEGNLNWPAILKAAEAGGVEHLLVEQDNCYERDPFESMAISYRNLKAMGFN